MAEKTLYLIDGHALLYRSYYAIRNLSTTAGFPTNAIFGFVTALRKLRDEAKPTHLGIVFDAPGRKIRHDVFEAYKAQRKPMPEDLAVQIPKLREVIEALRIPAIALERYEADDVLASLADKAAKKGFRTVVVTTDKDLLQIVGDKVSVYNPAKEIVLNPAKVKETFGVRPDQVVDLLALWGDPSDNVPGVPGIGEKTARSLIEEYGSLDNLLAKLDKLPNPRLKERLSGNLDKLEMSRKLVVIERGLDVPFDPAEFEAGEPDAEAAARLFRELEFNALSAEFTKMTPAPARDYKAVTDLAGLEALVGRIRKAGRVSIDTETDNISPTRARLVGMSFALEPGEAFYLPLRHDYLGVPAQMPVEKALAVLRGPLEDPAIKKIGQNIKYDLIVLEREGVRVRGVEIDTMVLSYLLEPNWGKHNLDRLALAYLHLPSIPIADIIGKGKKTITMDKASIEAVTPYACQDADYALEIARILMPKVETAGLAGIYRDLELPLIEVLAGMETVGIKVDGEILKGLSEELGTELLRLEKQVYAASGTEFNINSPAQLSEILFHKLQLTGTKKTKAAGALSTSMAVLEELAPLHPLPRLVLEYRQLAKLRSTYADALLELIDPATGRIHTSYNQTVAATGRLSSSDPNLQNIPARGEWGKRFRTAFVPEKGFGFLAADYSQIELRVLAHMSEDPALIETFAAGRDVHEETAARVFGPSSGLFNEERRRRAKIINFSMIYGASAYSLAGQLGTSNREAQDFIDKYYATYPSVKAFLDRIVDEAAERGYSETLAGRKRPVPELRSADKQVKAAGRRIALNTPLQGTAADIMKKAMIDVWAEISRRKLAARIVLQVHDELVLEVPEAERAKAEAIVRERMESVCPFLVPLKVSLGWGPSWAEAK
jgi:DNA polymerase-1